MQPRGLLSTNCLDEPPHGKLASGPLSPPLPHPGRLRDLRTGRAPMGDPHPVPDPRRSLPFPPVSQCEPTGLASVFGASGAHRQAKGSRAPGKLRSATRRRLSSSVSLKKLLSKPRLAAAATERVGGGDGWLLGAAGRGRQQGGRRFSDGRCGQGAGEIPSPPPDAR